MQWNEFRSHVRHLSTRQQQRVHDAFELGKKLHEGQKRKSGEPYYSHPVAVADMLADMGADPDTLIAALLHDTVEDTPVTLAELDHLFDGHVMMLIEGVTKLDASDVEGKPNLNEQIETLRKMFTLMEKDVRIMVIKLIDRLHNMQTAEFLPPARRKALAKETLDVYVKIADQLCMQDIRDELEGLSLTVLEPDIFNQLSVLRTTNENQGDAIIGKMRTALVESPAIDDVVFEHKSWGNLRQQLQAEGMRVTGLTTLTAVCICKTVDDCYAALGALHQRWKREGLSFQDFINAPSVNGYRGLHTTVILDDGTRIRCKIRTEEMHAYARRGIALHCFEEEREGTLNFLPWAENISSLTKDTEGRSSAFWESLQNEILGESILIYGPADQSVTVPKGASVLDGAFYLFREDALRLKTIIVNGQTVNLSAPLEYTMSLQIVLDEEQTVERQWLEWAKTTMAMAMIRAALASKLSPVNKIEIGKVLLQKVLTERDRGFVQEIREDRLVESLKKFGYASADDVFLALSEGHLDPLTVYEELFTTKKDGTGKSAETLIVEYDNAVDDLETENHVHQLLSKSRHYIRKSKQVLHQRKNEVHTMLTLFMTPAEQRPFLVALEQSGVHGLRLRLARNRYSLIIVLLLLWGLDPLFAKILLNAGCDPSAMTFIRCWTCLGAALVTVLIQRMRGTPVSRISLRHPSLWIAGICFFVLGFMTYATLTHGSPFLYKTALRGSALLTTVPLLLRHQRRKSAFTFASVLAIAGFVIMAVVAGKAATVFAAATALIFGLYTVASDEFQRVQRVDMRYPQFFLAISAIAALCSLGLPLFTAMSFPSLLLILLVIGFTLAFVCLPYAFFYILSHDVDYGTLAPYFHGSIFITLLGQWAILGNSDLLMIPGAVLMIIASVIGTQKNDRTFTSERHSVNA